MNLPISSRLLACANFIESGNQIADIGCDHGYLSIYLLQKQIASKVFAADIREGPLQSAKTNAEKFGVANKISFYLSDGVTNVPRDFDVLICAGMGADTMISILENAPWLKDKKYRLVLQCQSKTAILRQYLYEHGWDIEDEIVIRDGRFLYTVIHALWQEKAVFPSPAEFYFPKVLLRHPTEEVFAYYQWVVRGLRTAVSHQNNSKKQEILKQLESLSESLNDTLEGR